MEHPFYVRGRGWVKAGQLKKADFLVDSRGNSLSIKDINRNNAVVDETVYTITVDRDHTYFVTDLDILVHNKPP